MTRIEPAPAKINLALHVTGRRADGYHLLDSLVVFTELGDRVTVSPGPPSLTVTGPFADAVPAGEDNLCLRALRHVGTEAVVVLDKHLPPASGIGGGTADAAAVLRALERVPERPEALGADLPACLLSRPLRMQGVGERITPVDLPSLHLVLVNPRVETPTPAVFDALERRDGPPLPDLPALADAGTLLGWLGGTRNDLQPPALTLRPVIADCLAALTAQGARLARMSGSGATCFGIFADAPSAEAAARAILAANPGWWARATRTITGLPSATPQG
ncbi:4-(cytidine 5'-diphospho)-2-C-methyl-D-erythritol kinase [Paracoccus sp. MC1862]|uniref:4-(cytidine 5'-diphospho)-2-C-methyl-D-erythritol kinase n=2 Tax=Paracoccus TaxID=265 RepID=UPI0016039AF1|nr:4-(cytidine 5'-diphospho)-2-C-methyl-D-erythritol kinase [Paracoccus sp. MC1862]MBB1492561.1 4-(cytidine 5'-diphospho)-2-C-methyl-D-erythritol kinase [Paracoccus sp. MC1854]MBB1498384.1 4-(cytidine 5'-diphospho)-2-C-methyl-D-erythritol kinase [Paracoccus sp. MC1862]QQO46488.1 4-(cytidine 5'-diphospho)-2-C-methyl-D-erythritol kinase [Paracoccus sp. MC1862]